MPRNRSEAVQSDYKSFIGARMNCEAQELRLTGIESERAQLLLIREDCNWDDVGE
jgi:hypothetical protein